jgi:hypothetical protein
VLGGGEKCALKTLPKDWTNLLVPGNDVRSEKRDTAGPLVQSGSRLRLAIGAHSLRRDRKRGCELQGFVGRQERHLEKNPSERVKLFYLISLKKKIGRILRFVRCPAVLRKSLQTNVLAFVSLVPDVISLCELQFRSTNRRCDARIPP